MAFYFINCPNFIHQKENAKTTTNFTKLSINYCINVIGNKYYLFVTKKEKTKVHVSFSLSNDL